MELWGSYWTAGLLWGVLLGRGQAVQQEKSALVHVWVQQDASSSVLLQGEVVQKADRSSSEGQLHGDLKLIKEDHEGKKIYSKSEGDDDDKDEGEKMKLWIGVVPVQIEKGSVPNQESFTAAVVNKMRRALVLGASALILLVLNQNTVREMDLSEVLTKPIIIIQSSENVTKLFSALLRGLHATARITFKTFLQNNLGVTLTLWSSCGRSRWGRFGEWQGVVCTGETNSPVQKYLQQLWNTVVFIALLLFTGVMVQARWQNQEHQPNEQLQVHLKQDLLNQLSELNSKKYTEQPHWNHEVESCAVCLESYTHNQWLRVLPCLHEFHRDCVDPWLLLQQTCPLCKRSVIGGHLK